MNEEFKESTLQLADSLDLDEVESAQLLFHAQDDVETFGRSHVACAIIRFHEHRQFLVECLRLILKCSVDVEIDEGIRDILRQFVGLILETKDGPARNASLYAQKCLLEMGNNERWLQALGERQQGNLALGQGITLGNDDIIVFQQQSLEQQHESLAAVITYLIRGNRTGVEDFYKFLDHLRSLDKWNNLTVHYVPVIIAFSSQCGSPDGSESFREARLLNSKIVNTKDSAPWALRYLQAATTTWWLAEYSGWYLEQPPSSPLQGADLNAEGLARSEAFFRALQDGAFECILCVCSYLRPDDWNDQMRNSLTDYLLRDAPNRIHGAGLKSKYFQLLVMEQLETFADAFITNMPDTLRKFRFEEDDQRKRLNSGVQTASQAGISEPQLHLERFLLIISYAFENRSEAAQSFWSDPDSNLYGFLQWASKRQSTPRAAAFCEALRSISQGSECAAACHHFLLEETSTSSGRMRRSTSLSWGQIIAELNLYASKIGEHSESTRPSIKYNGRPDSDDINEPESALMLECYLRLILHICRESTAARLWFLEHPTFRIVDVLFQLCSSAVPTRINACAFATLQALLTEKSLSLGMKVWSALDQWVAGGFVPSPSMSRPAKVTTTSVWMEEVTFEAISEDLEETSEFIGLLHSLITPANDESGLGDSLPFPESLGSTYRMPGITPYIDFILGRIGTLQMIRSENNLQLRILRLNILNFVATSLTSFNEDLVILANGSTLPIDSAINATSLLSYVRLHPFSRVMEWMFNERFLPMLFGATHQDIDELLAASPDGPLALGLQRSIDVVNLVIDLQSTYLNIVRPLIKLQSTGHNNAVFNPSFASFESSIEVNLRLVVDLGLYCGAGMQELAISSLSLLEKLTCSRKLNAYSLPGMDKRLVDNRLISVLTQENELERVSKTLTQAMQFDIRELSYGIDAPGWAIKLAIIEFLLHCLVAASHKPNLAHALLGFHCAGSWLDIESNGTFAHRSSLFHAILQLVIEYPNEVEGSKQFWSLSLKQRGLEVLSTLWSTPLTSSFTLAELRASNFFSVLFLQQGPISLNTPWDGRYIKDPDFMSNSSALTLKQYIRERCFLYEYACIEIRLAAQENISSLKTRVLSTLLGSTIGPDGHQISNLTIFDLFDFTDIDIPEPMAMPPSTLFDGVNFEVSLTLGRDAISGMYDINIIEEMISLCLSQVRKNGGLSDQNEEQQALVDAQILLLYYQSKNNYRQISITILRTLRAWTNLLALVIGNGDLEGSSKTSLILQSFQVLTPKLEKYAANGVEEAIDIARLTESLLVFFSFEPSTLDGPRGGEIASDRLFHVFRTVLRSISAPDVDAELREVLYYICHRYLTGMANLSGAPLRRRHSTQTIKTAGEKLIDIICDDAYGGSGTCRISALLLLDSLVRLTLAETSSYLVDSLVRTNFVLVLVETIKSIPQELQSTDANGMFSCGQLITR